MEKVLGYKKIVFSFANTISGRLLEYAPFLKSPSREKEHDFNFDNRKDYLFLPEMLSIKTYWQRETISFVVIATISLLLFIGLLSTIFATNILITITTLVALLYLGLVIFKAYVVYKGFSYEIIDFTQAEIDAVTDEELPIFSVFVPLLNEADVMQQIITSLSSLDYPANKIDMVLTMHESDTETIKAFQNANAPAHFTTHMVPESLPQTKPKDLNTAFQKAKGEFFVIYDAEIIPDADQLKKAYLAFKHNPDIDCFQTRLEHYNAEQNILTKLFNMEFSFYYDYFLPGLQRLGFPIPLSGHSTHFRTNVIADVGAWDSYNVAEDCDLGMRLYRYGHKTAILNSFSQEEAASSVGSWIQQRTRWMKGFIQTSIVHMRHPFHLKNQLGGWKYFLAFLVTVPGTVLVNFLNLASWILLLFWIFSRAEFIKDLYIQPTLYISVLAFVAGMFLFTYLNLMGSFNRKKFHLVKYGLLTPLYWLMLAYATTRAVYQTFSDPYVWEKTEHGTHLNGSAE